jgi:hypothetical protein
MNATDRIKYAEQRIKELKLLIHHWEKALPKKELEECDTLQIMFGQNSKALKKHEKQKQVPKA